MYEGCGLFPVEFINFSNLIGFFFVLDHFKAIFGVFFACVCEAQPRICIKLSCIIQVR